MTRPMSKQHILEEIARTARLNGGVPLGRARFYQETGIKEADWSGKYWARWGDAVMEAGFAPNRLQAPLKEDVLLDHLARLVCDLGRWPVVAELKLKAKEEPGFPSHNTIGRLGGKAQQVAKLAAYCQGKPKFAGVLAVLPVEKSDADQQPNDDLATPEAGGYVYLLKAARYFKIGRSTSFERRSRQLAIQMPERADTVHVIRTDDPVGIELYWHRRFEAKRKNGEWFELNAQDVKAFKRRKFM